MKIRPLFAWFDAWVGVFYDRKARKIYVMPLPCFGFVFTLKAKKITGEMPPDNR